MAVVNLTSENFENEVMKAKVPVLIDFWAPWCGPCKMMGPIVEEISKELGETVKVGKINIDEEEKIATSFHVMSIPTFIVVKEGKVAAQSVGVQPKENIIKMVK